MYENLKDKNPIDTIKDINMIFKKLNIELEENWLNPIDGVYSLNLRVIGTNLVSNGKGINPDLAQASAYAEMLERVQEGIPFRLLDSFNIFKKVNVNTAIIDDEKVIQDYISSYLYNYDILSESEIEIFLNDFMKLIYQMPVQEIISYKTFEGRNIELPGLFVDTFYGSNGIAAGNTKYECLNQAIFEMIERYTIKKILNREITKFSDITEFIRDNYNDLSFKISDLEEYGLSIKIIDTSFEYGLPTIIVLLIDKHKKRYFASCGCHANLKIAIERSVTEIFQGRTIDDLKSTMTNLNASVNDKFEENYNSIFINGEGAYPHILFDFESMNTYPGVVWDELSNLRSNKCIWEFISNILYKRGYEIMVANHSKTGFFTYQIIVPKMSEVTHYTNYEFIKDFNDTIKVKKLLCKNKNKIDDNQVEILISYFTKYKFKKDYVLSEFIILPIENSRMTSLDGINIDLLLSICYSYKENYVKARDFLKLYYEEIKKYCYDMHILNYYDIAINIYNLRSQSYNDIEITNILKNFYTIEEIKEVINDLSKDKLFLNIPYIPCISLYTCDTGCHLYEECNIKNYIDVYVKINSY
ncbi:YcaO-like family protein [Anaerococcus sp. Marseille-P3915]|uniref:YcaO-like family protein n=1 Tax=Anaerococcus sp. Marseille-P3915 TaxID=2057799 RepID=UPI000D0B8AEF|nr:YcaO-like family protein [Anaerococcus sp. Marseille-P3915]